jgi:hypothetical protein
MKAICVSEFGGLEVLKLEDMPDPRPPQSGGVLVSGNAAGVTEESYAQKMRDWQRLVNASIRYVCDETTDYRSYASGTWFLCCLITPV